MESNQLNNVPNEDAVIELLTLTCKVDKYGNKTYYNKEGQRHRIHGPATITSNGSEFWYKNDKFHRADGPAVIYEDGSEEWWRNSKRHREDGPALIYPRGIIEYWINDNLLTKEEFLNRKKRRMAKQAETR